LFIVANRGDSDGLPERLPSLLEWNDLTASLMQGLDHIAIMTKILSKILHFFQQFLSFIEGEFTLAVGAVQQLFLTKEPKKTI